MHSIAYLIQRSAYTTQDSENIYLLYKQMLTKNSKQSKILMVIITITVIRFHLTDLNEDMSFAHFHTNFGNTEL